MAPSIKDLDPLLQDWLKKLKGVRVKKNSKSIDITLYQNIIFPIFLKNEDDAKTGEVYRIDIPPTVKIRLKQKDQVLQAKFIPYRSRDYYRVKLYAKIPTIFLQDKVTLDRVHFDMETGALQAEALWGPVRAVVKGNVYTKQIDGLDAQETIRRTFGMSRMMFCLHPTRGKIDPSKLSPGERFIVLSCR